MNKAVRLERLLLVIFAALTLPMPLLYLKVNYFIVAALGLVGCALIVARYQRSHLYAKMRRVVVRHPAWTVFGIALFTRLLCVAIISPHTHQVSDFLGMYTDSLQRVPTSHAPVWTHYITYPYLLHFLVDAFGKSTAVGATFNALVCSVSIALTYLIGTQIVNKKVGFVAAMLMTAWPGEALYTTIYAPDHLSICFMLLGILCFLRLLAANQTKPKVLYAVACAASLWGLGFFKDVTPVLIIAFVLTVLIQILRSKSIAKNLITIYCTLGICVFSMFGSITHVPIISAIAGRPVNPSLLSYFVYIGLGNNDHGSWDPVVMGHYNNLMKQDHYNYALANHTMMHEALSGVKDHLPRIPLTLWNKSWDVQSNDVAKITWIEQTAQADNSTGLHDTLQIIGEPVNDIFYAGLVMLICVSVYYMWTQRRYMTLLLPVTVCIGYSGLLLIIEAQNRYRYLIEPLYCILAAYGFMGLYASFRHRSWKRS